jgi:hypothetical protein
MKILFISIAVVSLLISNAFCGAKTEHEKSTDSLKDAIKVSPSKDNLLLALPDISKNLTGGEVIVCSQKGNDGKYTLFYSSVSGGATSEVLSGERESNTRKMFNSVSAMKAGSWMGYDFNYQKNGKDIPMKSRIFPVSESVICVLVWPISGLTDDISFGMDMAKVAPSTAPVVAAPLISPAAPMQQSQDKAVPVDGASAQIPPAENPAANQTTPPVTSPVAPASPPAADPAAVPPPVPEAAPAPADPAAVPPAAAPDPAAVPAAVPESCSCASPSCSLKEEGNDS